MSDDMSVDSEQNKEELIEFFEKEKEKNNSNFLSKTRILALSLIPGVKQITQFRSDLIEYLDENEVLRLVEFFYGINYPDVVNTDEGIEKLITKSNLEALL
ncbi:hypothetical protein E4V27_09335, partial [Proteus mirabilis]